ncbi:LysE family transporter [Arthrobacter psychrochitiniphilus]|uniref:Lysine transporter LysE n=1 Tax=Arthrobacter psychrochitiniphilus TaxID=291045 RepID=A0A2V3DU46_9MICC|nr:LysE family transporter [Arthrobacter psychrochitiniphilus]NYG15625.1 homoserine/homoserine lactone efflux protein [Arthrobacter psychrochitiniphilus]PXA66890.1 lysine transporter LysE [Arthrobacter psychrochitiniphilus]
MQFSLWLALVGAGAMISLTPGAGAINTMSNALTSGFRRSFWGILGQQVALVIHVIVVAAGVGIIVSSSPFLFLLIRYVGAAYLVYLGIRKLLAKAETADAGDVPAAVEHGFSMFRRGLWVNLLNPKAIVFFLAFMPQFIRPSEPLLAQYVILTATVVVIDIIVMWFVFAAGAKQLKHLTTSERGQLILNRIFGILFIGVGVALALA